MARREWNVGRNGEFVWLAKSAGFRRNPQQHAGTGAIRQEKTPTENGWGFIIGGGGVHLYLVSCCPIPSTKPFTIHCIAALPVLYCPVWIA